MPNDTLRDASAFVPIDVGALRAQSATSVAALRDAEARFAANDALVARCGALVATLSSR